jgi:hypothetical protein
VVPRNAKALKCVVAAIEEIVVGLSLPVAIAYWAVAWTADTHGFHCFPCSDCALPPRKKDRLLSIFLINSILLCVCRFS